jgi:predicted negative regulator of RcsB-dependent stress response
MYYQKQQQKEDFMKSLKTSFAFALVFSILFISTSQGLQNYNDECHNKCNKKELTYKEHLYKAGQDLVEQRSTLLAKNDNSCEKIKNNAEARKEYNDQGVAFECIKNAVSEMSDGNLTEITKGEKFRLCKYNKRKL